MRIASILLPACLLATLPFASHAEQHCEHSAPRDSALNLDGISRVVFDIGPHQLTVNGGNDSTAAIRGRACASDSKRLADLIVTQQRKGDTLTIRAERTGLLRKVSWSGDDYSYLSLTAALPGEIAVEVTVGSGDAVIGGVASLRAQVGSGELEARRIRGAVHGDVDSGEIKASDIGALHVGSVGSGALSARDVRGDATVGEVNSGDLTIANAKGRVEIRTIGSGNASLSGIAGNVAVKSIGSGDLDAHGVSGDLIVDAIGSGSVDHRNVRGRVQLPKDY